MTVDVISDPPTMDGGGYQIASETASLIVKNEDVKCNRSSGGGYVTTPKKNVTDMMPFLFSFLIPLQQDSKVSRGVDHRLFEMTVGGCARSHSDYRGGHPRGNPTV